MMYILDSDIVINHLNGVIPIPKEILQNSLSISVITYIEVLYGIKKRKNTKQESLFIETLTKLHIEILPITYDITHVYIPIKLELEAKGKKIDEFDLLIAATAIHHNLTLVTHNSNHFKRIPNLSVYPIT